jgi:hypothetical protein
MHDHRILDFTAWLSAIAAVASLANAALLASFVAALISIALGAFRLHDRIKYGPKQ